MPNANNYQVRVVLNKTESGYRVAQGLEFDISAQGKSIREAKSSFAYALIGHLMYAEQKKMKPFQGVPKAPKKYWEKFKQGEELQNPISLPSAKIRSFATRKTWLQQFQPD